MSVFFLGTCRAHDLSRLIRRLGIATEFSSHRVGTPKQILQFIRFMEEERPFPNEAVHFLTYESYKAAAAGDLQSSAEQLIATRTRWRQHSAFIAEVSGIKERMLDIRGTPFACGMYIHRHWEHARSFCDLPAPRSRFPSAQAAASTLQQARKLLRRPVVWISYAVPGGSESVYQKRISEALRTISERCGDGFVDPNAVRVSLGNDTFFAHWRQDPNHYSGKALRKLADQIVFHLSQIAVKTAQSNPSSNSILSQSRN